MVNEPLASNRLRVQIVSKPGSKATGIGRYAHELERGLAQQPDVDLRVAELRDPVPAPITGLARRMGYDLAAFNRSYPLRADVVPGWITHLTNQTLATLLTTQRLTRPVVVTVHDIFPYMFRDDPELRVYGGRLDRAMDRRAMRGLTRADRLIADSAYTRATLMHQLGIPADRIDVVHLGIDTAVFAPRPPSAALRDRLKIGSDQPMALFVGSEDPRKDLPTLLRAVAIARSELPGLVLVKAGAAAFAEQRRRHLELARELGIAEAVRWVDAVSEEELVAFYATADCFAFPSRYEGFGFPVLEAMACGTPVVAVDASSVSELLGDHAQRAAPRDPEGMAAGLVACIRAGRGDVTGRVAQAATFTWERTVRATAASLRTAAA